MIMAARFCHNCGAPLKEDQRFCTECGAAVQVPITETKTNVQEEPVTPAPERPEVTPAAPAPGAPEEPAAPVPAAPPKKKFPWAVVIIVALCAVIGLVLLATGRNKGNDGSQKIEAGPRGEDSGTKPEFNEGGDYSGEADENNKDSDGMTLPDMTDGETLYIGYGELPDVGLTKVALVLSEDETMVHNLVIFLDDINDTVDGVNVPFSNLQTTYSAEFTLPVEDEELGASTIKDLHMEGDNFYMNIDYVFNNAVFGSSSDVESIPLGEMEVWLKKAGE